MPELWLTDPLARTVEIYALAAERSEYLLRERRVEGETVSSAVLSELRLEISELFPSDI